MKVFVSNNNQEVIDKIGKMEIPDLEIVGDVNAAKLILTEEKQQRLLAKPDGQESAGELINIFLEENASDFFKLNPSGVKPMSINVNNLKKRRAKNKVARASRKMNGRKLKRK